MAFPSGGSLSGLREEHGAALGELGQNFGGDEGFVEFVALGEELTEEFDVLLANGLVLPEPCALKHVMRFETFEFGCAFLEFFVKFALFYDRILHRERKTLV